VLASLSSCVGRLRSPSPILFPPRAHPLAPAPPAQYHSNLPIAVQAGGSDRLHLLPILHLPRAQAAGYDALRVLFSGHLLLHEPCTIASHLPSTSGHPTTSTSTTATCGSSMTQSSPSMTTCMRHHRASPFHRLRHQGVPAPVSFSLPNSPKSDPSAPTSSPIPPSLVLCRRPTGFGRSSHRRAMGAPLRYLGRANFTRLGQAPQ
jgi:hypothetical protein